MLSNEARNLLVKTYEQMPDAVKAARTAGDVRLFAVGAERFSQLLGNQHSPLFSFAVHDGTAVLERLYSEIPNL